MLPKTSVLLTFLSLWTLNLPTVLAWGNIGHRTIAYLAEKYLSPGATTYVSSLLGDTDISDAAIWADQVKRTHEFHGTDKWHYIDAEDDPPRTCQVNFGRDCNPGPGCVVSAIMNMTERVNDPDLSAYDHGNALKFLLHFIGDVHQPLHTEAEDRGGNGIEVEWGRKKTNLHAVWDSMIIEKLIGWRAGDEEHAFSKEWANKLFGAGGSGLDLQSECDDVQNAQGCALAWASEANKWICDYVLKDDVEGVEGKDLTGEYYSGAVPIVEDLIGKAGRRLAAWINALAAQGTAMEEDGKLQVQEL
jgi:S1/P1 Nuclease